jgi:hypothetical protein
VIIGTEEEGMGKVLIKVKNIICVCHPRSSTGLLNPENTGKTPDYLIPILGNIVEHKSK